MGAGDIMHGTPSMALANANYAAGLRIPSSWRGCEAGPPVVDMRFEQGGPRAARLT